VRTKPRCITLKGFQSAWMLILIHLDTGIKLHNRF